MKRIVILEKMRSEESAQLSHINSQELDWKCPPLQEAGYYINQTSRGGVANRRREEVTNGQADPLVRALRVFDTHFHSAPQRIENTRTRGVFSNYSLKAMFQNTRTDFAQIDATLIYR